MPYKRVGKIQEDGRKMACWGLAFVPLDSASRLLVHTSNIYESRKVLFSLLASQAPPYDKALDWIQLSYTGDWKGAYVAPTPTDLVHYVLTDRVTLFSHALHHHQCLYPGAYANTFMSTMD